MIIGWTRQDLLGGLPYPRWLLVLGTLVCLLTRCAASPAVQGGEG